MMEEATPGVVVRLAEPGDEEAVWRLARQLATSYVLERVAFARSFQRILADPAAAVLVVEDEDSRVVGYAHVLVHPAFHANGDIAWVEELLVQPDRQRRGLGRLLMHAAERWAVQEARAVYLALATRRAADFYHSLGYEDSATYFKRTRPSPPAR